MALPETNEGKILSDAWDYKGRPAEKSKTGGWTSAAMILGPYQALPYSILVPFETTQYLFNMFWGSYYNHHLFPFICCCLFVSTGVELWERLTTLGIAVNLVTYLTGTMHLGNAASANTVTNFLGTSFMLCLLGGFVADTFLGRYVQSSLICSILTNPLFHICLFFFFLMIVPSRSKGILKRDLYFFYKCWVTGPFYTAFITKQSFFGAFSF